MYLLWLCYEIYLQFTWPFGELLPSYLLETPALQHTKWIISTNLLVVIDTVTLFAFLDAMCVKTDNMYTLHGLLLYTVDKELFGGFSVVIIINHVRCHRIAYKNIMSLYALLNYILRPGVENQSVLYYTSKQQQQKNLWKIKLRKQNLYNLHIFPNKGILPSETGCSLSRICTSYVGCVSSR